ncbi:hypothetical protein IJI17_01425 [Candidatus Saccharibacteria bacterium]|nr:hypothetical protein [Candidatus Saccharibacteria bacterium]
MTEKFKAVLVCLAFSALFYGFFYLCYRKAFGKNFLRENFTKGQLRALILFAFLAILFCVYILSKNDYVYTWDSAGYWTWSYEHMQNLFTSPYWGVSNLIDSIMGSDYNLLLPTLIALPLKFFGYTFERYVFVNFCWFVLPACFLAICLARKIFATRTQRKDLNWLLLVSTAAAFYLTKALPVFQGYIDVAILIPITLLVALVMDYDPTKPVKSNFRVNLLISFLLVITFLFRRYTAFFVVGFFIALGATSLMVSLTSGKRQYGRKLSLCRSLLNLVSIGGVALATLLIFFHKLVFRILGENYSELYSAYNDPLSNKLLSVVTRFGLIFLSLAIAGVFFSLKKRKLLKTANFCVVSIVSTIALFFTVQRIDGHHALTLVPQLFTLICLGLSGLLSSFKKRRRLITIILIVLILSEIPYCYVSRIKLPSPLSYLYVQKYNPLYRSDMQTLREIKDYINSINHGASTYVLSSSVALNSGTLGNLERPYVETAVNGLAFNYAVDLRDGFPDSLMTAQYIITASPVQTHLKEGSQETVSYFATLVQDQTSYFGRHFEQDAREFVIGQGITVLIYKKISEFTPSDYAQMYDYFTALYPDAPDKFAERIKPYLVQE